MHKRPLAVIAIFFILGIVLAKFLPDSVRLSHVFVVTLIFVALTLIFALTLTLSHKWERELFWASLKERGKVANIFLLLSVALFATLLYINSNIFPNNHISYFLGEDKIKTDMVGIIKTPTLTRKPYYGKISSTYLFEVEAIRIQGSRLKVQGEWQKMSGLALIRIQTEKDYQYGDRLVVKGTIRRLGVVAAASYAANMNKGHHKMVQLQEHKKNSFDYREYLKNQNIFAIINTTEKNVTLLLHNYKSNPILRYAYSIREKLKNRFLEKMPLETGAFMRAILLGDRSELPKDIQESFRNSGTMHILAISGLHVGLVAAFFLYFFRFIGLRREISYIVIMFFLVFLMLLTGARPSVVRAVVMCIVFLTGMLLGRAVDPYNTLAVAALFILIKNPKDVFDVGFQLSFLAVLSMVYFTPKLMRLVRENVNFYVRKYLWSPFAVSLSASVGTFPLIMYYFRMFVPISVVSNIFIVPIMFVLMIGGLGFSALGWVPLIGDFLAGFNHILSSTIFFLAKFFADVRFGHFYI